MVEKRPTASVSVADLFTNEQIEECLFIVQSFPDSEQASVIADAVISPNLQQLQATLGQIIDPRYLAYMLIYACKRELQRN